LGHLPRRALILWAALVPLAYAPSFAVGNRPTALVTLLIVLATALAFAAVAAINWLERAESSLGGAMPILLGSLAVLYTAWATFTAHARLEAVGDFSQSALYGQSFWTLLHGLPFANTHETLDGTLGSHFGVHFSPTLLLLAPFYRLWPSPLLLLAFQSLAIALVPLPVYALFAPLVGRVAAALFGLAALALTGLLWAGPADFFDANFLPVLVLAMVWAMERRRWGWFTVFALLSLGVREEVGVTLVLVAAWALLRGYRWRVSLAIAALGIVWFAVVIKAVIPHFSSPGMWTDPKRFFVSMFGQWGDTPSAAVRGMLAHPVALVRWLASHENLVFLRQLLVPFLYFPPLLDLASLPALPGLSVILLSRLGFMKGGHYANLPATFLALGTLFLAARVVARSGESKRAATALALAVVILAGTLPWLAMTWPAAYVSAPAPPADATARVASLVPDGAPVYATVKLYPRLCNRDQFGCWWSTYERGRDPAFRARYRFFVLWPGGDPDSAASRDRPLADSLAHDARYVERPGYEPFVVFERR
jgi:uncharacterized membrane protein